MADFYQFDLITTLHGLSRDGVARMETELERFKPVLPIGLALPALYSEFETPAMRRIAEELGTVRYLQRIVVALGRADRNQYEQACEFFRDIRAGDRAMDGRSRQRRCSDYSKRMACPLERTAKADRVGWRSVTCWRASAR